MVLNTCSYTQLTSGNNKEYIIIDQGLKSATNIGIFLYLLQECVIKFLNLFKLLLKVPVKLLILFGLVS